MGNHSRGASGSDAAPLSEFPGVSGGAYVYEMLGHRRRRLVCRAVAARNEWSVTALAGQLAAWESPTDEPVSDGVVERVEISLYHAHLPKLSDADVITFDSDSGTVRPGENAAEMSAVLRGIDAVMDS